VTKTYSRHTSVSHYSSTRPYFHEDINFSSPRIEDILKTTYPILTKRDEAQFRTNSNNVIKFCRNRSIFSSGKVDHKILYKCQFAHPYLENFFPTPTIDLQSKPKPLFLQQVGKMVICSSTSFYSFD